MHFMVLFIVFLALTHTGFIALFIIGLKTGRRDSVILSRKKEKITILVPARNEEENLEDCVVSLTNQDYPKELTEIIIIDDDSTDGTMEIAGKFAAADERITAIKAPKWREGLPRSPKKKALMEGITRSSGDLILACDADCVAPSTWVSSMVSHFTEDVVMVAGYAGIDTPGDGAGKFIKIQALELLSLFTCAAGSISIGWPLASSGSNQAFRKKQFLETGGYGKSGDIVSGDDDLLLQRLTGITGMKVRFNRDPGSFMYTEPMKSLKDFYLQRKRWGAKYTYYRPSYKFFLTQYYLLNLMVFLSVLLPFFSVRFLPLTVLSVLVKILPEYVLMFVGTGIFKRKDLRKYLPLWTLFQIPYIVFMGPLSLVTPTTWKGRKFGTRSRAYTGR